MDDAQSYERQAGASCAWVVTVTRNERVRKQMHDMLAPRTDVRVVGDAVDAVAAMIICLIARPDVLLMDPDLPSDEARTVTRRVGSVSPSTWIGTWARGHGDHPGAGAPWWVEPATTG